MYDNPYVINCPACGMEMEKVYISSLGLDVDICSDGCGGIFFDENEFNQFYNHTECISDISEYTDKFYPPTNQSKKRQCPVCNIDMVKSMVKNNTVEIDICNRCGGVFLDKGELERLCAVED